VAIDYEAEGLLEGLDDDSARAARVELLGQLSDAGFSLDELRKAAEEGRLALLPVERVLEGDGPRYSIQEVADRSGLELDFLEALWRALGVARPGADDKAFSEEDVEAARLVRRSREAGIPDDGVLELSRVMGQGMAALAAAIGRVFGEAFLHPGDTERDLGLRYAEASRELAPLIGPTVQHVLRIHQREHVRQAVVGAAELDSGRLPGSAETAVCFADLVGFTKLGERVPPDELGAVAGRLNELALEIVAPPVRLVKTIGDAAMLVSPEADTLLGTALDLVAAADAEGQDFPPLRAGLALGQALPRGGDWYGRPVNLASRITDFARPASVVAAAEVREASEGDWAWSRVGRRRFKGVDGEVALFRVRRETAGDG
jgi:adenylate cyclase